MKLIVIDADFILRLKLEKTSETTGHSIDRLVCQAVEHFLSSQGYNNPLDTLESSSIDQQ